MSLEVYEAMLSCDACYNKLRTGYSVHDLEEIMGSALESGWVICDDEVRWEKASLLCPNCAAKGKKPK